MKSSRTYKAALFIDSSIPNGFWKGNATDKQINNPRQEIAHYWIYGFLKAEFEITGKSGSFMFSRTLSSILNSKIDNSAKEQLIALLSILPNQNGKTISIQEMCQRIGMPIELQNKIIDSMDNRSVFQTRFQFDNEEFRRTLKYRSEYLDNGAILTASAEDFEVCFKKEALAKEKKIRYTTEGQLLEVKVKKRI